MKIEVIDNKAMLLAEKDTWQDFVKAGTNPFLDINTFISWLAIFGCKQNIYVLRISEGDDLLGYAPFLRKKNRVSWLGEGRVNYLDLVALEQNKVRLWPEILEFLAKSGVKTISLSSLNSFSSSFALIDQNSSFRSLRSQVCPYLKVDPTVSWEDFLNVTMSTKRRYEARRGLKKLKEAGEVTIAHNRVQDLSGKEKAEIFELYRLRWQESYRSKLIKDSYFEYQQLLMKSLENGLVSTIYHNGELVSFIWGFLQNDIFVDYFVAHHPGYGRYSLGLIHLTDLIKHLHGRGIVMFDFSLGDDVYKRKWAKEESYTVSYISTGNGHYLWLMLLKKLKMVISRMLKKIL